MAIEVQSMYVFFMRTDLCHFRVASNSPKNMNYVRMALYLNGLSVALTIRKERRFPYTERSPRFLRESFSLSGKLSNYIHSTP